MSGKIKLYCIPHAGASAYYYLPLKSYLRGVELVPLELNGRGSRFSMPRYRDFNEAVEDVSKRLCESIDNQAYALFGHSMGCCIAYEACLRMISAGVALPKYLFLSGYAAPGAYADANAIDFDTYTDDAFIDYLRSMGGMDVRLLLNKDLLNTFLPIIRSDFRLLNTYSHAPNDQQIDTNVTVIAGEDDAGAQPQEMAKWQRFVTQDISYARLPGSHFYMKGNWKPLADVILGAMRTEALA